MSIRIVFGYLFFLLSVLFCAVQLVTLQRSEHFAVMPLVLQFCSALICLVLASLAAQSRNKNATVVISIIALSVCFLALLAAGILAMQRSSEMSAVKYLVFLAYAGLYGMFGVIFSLVASKSAKNEVSSAGN